MTDRDLTQQSVEMTPRSGAFGAPFDWMLDRAANHLPEPVTASVHSWDDGEFRIQVYHHVPPDSRKSLYYHSDEDVLRYGVEDGDELVKNEILCENPREAATS